MAFAANEIVILATARAKPGREADLEAALREVAAPTRAQKGCLQFELYRPPQDPGTIVAFEHWASSEDHQQHLQGDHLKRLMARFDGILASPPDIMIMNPL
jgi:quinol monooxygenase YgiN